MMYGSWIGSSRGFNPPSGEGLNEKLLRGIGSIAPSATRLNT